MPGQALFLPGKCFVKNCCSPSGHCDPISVALGRGMVVTLMMCPEHTDMLHNLYPTRVSSEDLAAQRFKETLRAAEEQALLKAGYAMHSTATSNRGSKTSGCNSVHAPRQKCRRSFGHKGPHKWWSSGQLGIEGQTIITWTAEELFERAS